MKNMKRVLALVLAVAMVFALTACTGKKESTSVLNVHIGSEPETIDPALNTSVDGGTMINHLFEGLMVIGKDKLPHEGMAEKYNISADGKVYTFTLRDAKWSDGQAVKASDFVYAWRRLVNPKTAAEYSYMLNMVKGVSEITGSEKPESVTQAQVDAIGIVAKDDKTVEVTLATKCEYFLEICAFPATYPVREDIISKNDKWTQTPESLVCNGPLKLKSWTHKSKLIMEKNNEYYNKDAIKPQEIAFHLMDDDNAILGAYKSGTLVFADEVPVGEYDALKASKDLVIEDQLGTYFVAFNTKKAPFNDPKVRKAFTLAIDRNKLGEVSKDGKKPADAFVPGGMFDADTKVSFRDLSVGKSYYSVKAEDLSANITEAKKLLKEAGFENGKNFPSVEYIYNTTDLHKNIAEALQAMWKENLGVTITLQNQDWSVFIPTRQAGDFSIARHGWLADYNDPMSFLDMWHSKSANNDADYVSAAYDAKLSEITKTEDRAARFKLMHEAEDILMADMPIAPLQFYTDPYVIKSNVEGFYTSPLGFKYFMYAEVK